MTKAQEVYEQVQALRKKDPSLGIQAAVKQVGGVPSQYYHWIDVLNGKATTKNRVQEEAKPTKRRKHKKKAKTPEVKTITVPEEVGIDSGFIVAMVGTPDKIAASLRQLMK